MVTQGAVQMAPCSLELLASNHDTIIKGRDRLLEDRHIFPTKGAHKDQAVLGVRHSTLPLRLE